MDTPQPTTPIQIKVSLPNTMTSDEYRQFNAGIRALSQANYRWVFDVTQEAPNGIQSAPDLAETGDQFATDLNKLEQKYGISFPIHLGFSRTPSNLPLSLTPNEYKQNKDNFEKKLGTFLRGLCDVDKKCLAFLGQWNGNISGVWLYSHNSISVWDAFHRAITEITQRQELTKNALEMIEFIKESVNTGKISANDAYIIAMAHWSYHASI